MVLMDFVFDLVGFVLFVTSLLVVLLCWDLVVWLVCFVCVLVCCCDCCLNDVFSFGL